MKYILFALLFITSNLYAQIYPVAQSQKYISALNSTGENVSRVKDHEILFFTGILVYSSVSFNSTSLEATSSTMRRINLIIGTTAATHALDYFNLTSVTYTGSPTQNDGAIPLNGTSQFLTTDYNINSTNQNSKHVTFVTSTANSACACGEINGGSSSNNSFGFRKDFTGTVGSYWASVNATVLSFSRTAIATAGATTLTRVNSTECYVYHNGVAVGTNPISSPQTTAPAGNVTVGALASDFSGRFSNRTITGYSLGSLMTTTQMISEHFMWTYISTLK